MIEIKSLTKKYGELTILDNISITLKKGSKNAIMGSSGKGKTTLLRIIAGLEHSSNGTATTNGNIAYMFQEPALLPWKRARDNVRSVLKKCNYHLAEKYLEAVDLSEAIDKFPHELSGGMAQRVAFARFLAFAEATNADVLMLDEPFSALDRETADKMSSILLKIAEGRTLLLVTHDINQANRLDCNIINI